MPSLEGCAQAHILSKSFLFFVKTVWIKIDEGTKGISCQTAEPQDPQVQTVFGKQPLHRKACIPLLFLLLFISFANGTVISNTGDNCNKFMIYYIML